MFKLPEFPAYYGVLDKLGWLALRLGALLVLLFLVLPIAVIVPLSFSDSTFLAYPIEGWSLQWYREMWNAPEWARAARNSFIVAPAATLLPPCWAHSQPWAWHVSATWARISLPAC